MAKYNCTTAYEHLEAISRLFRDSYSRCKDRTQRYRDIRKERKTYRHKYIEKTRQIAHSARMF